MTLKLSIMIAVSFDLLNRVHGACHRSTYNGSVCRGNEQSASVPKCAPKCACVSFSIVPCFSLVL